MSSHPSDLEAFAELADLLLNVGRLVRVRAAADDAIALTEIERTVMRVVDLFPGSSPSEIAQRAQWQPEEANGCRHNGEYYEYD